MRVNEAELRPFFGFVKEIYQGITDFIVSWMQINSEIK